MTTLIENLSEVYLYIAVFGTVVFILKTALPIDVGGEIQSDFTSITDTDTSFNLFTIEGLASFLMCGGWLGYISFSKLHYELKISLLIAVVSGIIGMIFFTWLIAQFKKLEHTPTAKLEELIGVSGKAYMAFQKKGAAKIQIEFNSKLQILDAINECDEEIKAFEPIKVTRVENGNIYIIKEKC